MDDDLSINTNSLIGHYARTKREIVKEKYKVSNLQAFNKIAETHQFTQQ